VSFAEAAEPVKEKEGEEEEAVEPAEEEDDAGMLQLVGLEDLE